jgi:hypothetical protein
MDGIEATAVALFAFWLLVTILFQINAWGWIGWLKGHDYFAMIPAWTFFAPNPGTTDVHLLYRDKLSDGAVMGWREVPYHTSALRVVWNPHKRLQKGLSDLGNELQRYAADHLEQPELILTSSGFIALLNFVTRQPHALSTAFTQFAIARSYGFDSQERADVMFLSAFHRI